MKIIRTYEKISDDIFKLEECTRYYDMRAKCARDELNLIKLEMIEWCKIYFPGKDYAEGYKV